MGDLGTVERLFLALGRKVKVETKSMKVGQVFLSQQQVKNILEKGILAPEHVDRTAQEAAEAAKKAAAEKHAAAKKEAAEKAAAIRKAAEEARKVAQEKAQAEQTLQILHGATEEGRHFGGYRQGAGVAGGQGEESAGGDHQEVQGRPGGGWQEGRLQTPQLLHELHMGCQNL